MKKLLLTFVFLCGIIGAFAQTPQPNYGDSLKGFDETKTKIELFNIGLYGKEYQNHLSHLKRLYIDQKYNLNPIQIINPTGKPIGGNNSVNSAPCVNEDFESTTPGAYTTSNAVTGWTVTGKLNAAICPQTGFTAGSPHFSILATPILGVPFIGTLGNSPLGGNNVAQLNNYSILDYQITRIQQTFPVTLSNTLFQFAYAGIWQNGSHACCGQPGIDIKMYDCLGNPLSCSSLSLAPGGGCTSAGVTYTTTSGTDWTNWQVKYIDLTPYVGTCVTIEVIQADCAYGGHYGTVFFDAMCGGQLIGTGLGGAGGNVAGPVSFCAGSNMAQISAPLGYSTYQWYAPGTGSIAAPQGTMANLTISNPIPSSVYTVVMTAASGCVFTSTNAINFSTVNIAGIGSTSTCPGGASGSATVAGNGSGTGYNYTWINANTSATVGTASIVNNLAPGVYSVVLTGLGSAGCGTAVSTVTINTGQAGVISLLKPFCNNEAYLGTTGGSNFQWYNNLTAITASAGGTQANYTVTAPSNGAIYWLSYLSNQGCQDSVKFTLVSSTPGAITTTTSLNLVCPGASTGSMSVVMIPANGAPPGLNSYSVWATGTTTPYSASLSPTSNTVFPLTGLSAGTYSVKSFDGSCKYSTTFNINTFVYNYTVSPTNPTLCPGNNVAAAVTFTNPPSLTQYSYSWTPSTFLVGTNAQQTIISPSISVGTQTTIVYTVVVTPSLINCPIAKTISITVVNPAIPTISIIPPLCNTFAPYTIGVSPTGGTFNTLPISSIGVITPSLANIGVNTFTYAISVSTCIAKQTATYEVSTFVSSALTNSIPPLCVTNPTFNLNNIVSLTGGIWNGNGVVNNILDPSNLNTGNYILSYNTVSTPNPLTCPSTTTLNVSITNTLTPIITPIPEFCNNAGAITLTVTPSGGTWLGNGVSSNGVITPSLTNIPFTTLGYSINVGPCLNTATTTLFTSNFNTATLTGVIPDLCYNNTLFNLLSITQNTTGVWSGMNVINNSFNPNGLSSGNYVLTYNTISNPNPLICPDSKTISVNVLNPPIPNIQSINPVCSKDLPIQIQVNPSIGNWVNSSYLNNGLFTPSLAAIGNNNIKYIIGTSTCNVSSTININVEAFISAALLSNIDDQCNTSFGVNLSPITSNNTGIWTGNGILGSMFYPNMVNSGNHILTYNTKSYPSGLCPDHSTLSVNVYSLATPIIDKIGPFCNNALPIQLNVSPVGGLFGDAFNSTSLGGIFNPALGNIGTNIINYSITSGPCVAYAQTTISVEKFISAGFEKTLTPLCENDFPINLNSLVFNPGGDWTGTAIFGNMFEPSKAINKNIITYQTYSSPTKSLCPDQSTITIEVRKIPQISINASILSGCAPLEILFNTPSVNNGYGEWSFGDNNINKIGLNVNYVYSKPGNYEVYFLYDDGICDPITTQISGIKIYPKPIANFDMESEITISDPKVQISNLTNDLINNKYQWNVNNDSITNEINPILNFNKLGSYKITLLANTINNCKSEISKYINVISNYKLYIPNTFSPNYDGLNDEFYPITQSVRKYHMEIFDRWGELLFSQENGKWNGLYKNQIVKEGIYVYRLIIYKDNGEVITQMGHVTLIK